jgi:hypothetical protein
MSETREQRLEAMIARALPRVREFAGWYDKPGDEPSHVPGEDAPCPICWRPLALPKEDAMWTSLSYPGARRSMFYAMHPECCALGYCEARQAADAAVLDFSEMQ